MFPKRDLRKLLSLLFLQISFGLLDLFGIVLVGLIATLTVSEIGGGVTGDRVSQALNLLGIEEIRPQIQVAILGALTAILLVSKSIASLWFSNRSLLFLAKRAGQISSNLIEKYFNQNLAEVQKKSVQETLFLLTNGVNIIAGGILGSTLHLISDLSLMIVLGIGLLYVDKVVAISTLALFVVVGIGLYRFSARRVTHLAHRQRELTIDGGERITELQYAFREVYTKNQRQFYFRDITKNRQEVSILDAKIKFISIFGKYFFELTFVFGAFTIAAFQFSASSATRAITILGIFLAASARIMPAVLRIQQSLIVIRGYSGLAEPTLELYELLHRDTGELKSNLLVISEVKEEFIGDVHAEKISFKYENSLLNVIDCVDFKASAGEFVAIVGPSGAGKTTLFDVLLGLREPCAGVISISGLPPREALSKWGGKVAYIPQDSAIFSGSIKRNIALGFEEANIDETRCWSALEIANMYEFVQSLPNKLEEQVGVRGSKLSGGQRQRIGIARALYTNPKVIFFDEATSSLDSDTEAQISDAILSLKGEKTLITIAHRLSTVMKADRIYYMDDGRFIACGTFRDLQKLVPEFGVQVARMRGEAL